jgi:hypothetical protein
MTREYEESKIFSDNLDRLLSGGEVKAEAAYCREILEALDFAKKMNSLRSEPSYIELEDLDLQGKAVKLNLISPAEFEILPSY